MAARGRGGGVGEDGEGMRGRRRGQGTGIRTKGKGRRGRKKEGSRNFQIKSWSKEKK